MLERVRDDPRFAGCVLVALHDDVQIAGPEVSQPSLLLLAEMYRRTEKKLMLIASGTDCKIQFVRNLSIVAHVRGVLWSPNFSVTSYAPM